MLCKNKKGGEKMLDIYNDKYSYIIILNCLEEIIFCNKNFLNRLNYSSGEILNSNIKKIIIYKYILL